MSGLLIPIAANIINEVQTTAPVPKKTIEELADETLVPQGIDIPVPDSVFELDGIPVFTKMSIGTLIGKAKSGKTTALAWIVAQIINLKLNVLWIDTEQGKHYASRTQTWILIIAKLKESENLMYHDLSAKQPIERAQIMENLIVRRKPDLVIIDGIKDLVYDINSAEEATIMISNLMKLANENNCHIMSIIHQNKGTEYARGHLGTELVNKSETVIKVMQDEAQTIVCEPEFTRGKPFPIFAFARDANGVPQIVNYVPSVNANKSANKKGLVPIDVDNKTHFEFLERAYNGEDQLCYTDLARALKAAIGYYGTVPGDDRCKMFVSHYTQQNYIVKVLPKTTNRQFYQINFGMKNKELFTPISSNEDPPF